MFWFDFSPEFVLWALQPPSWLSQWHCGVQVVSSQKWVGFITAIPANIHTYYTEKNMVEINFLCVHKKLHSKKVVPVLIHEITWWVYLEGIFQAVYTATMVLPKPVGTCRYWHWSLNPWKLTSEVLPLEQNSDHECYEALPAARDSQDSWDVTNGKKEHTSSAPVPHPVPEAVLGHNSHEPGGGGTLVLQNIVEVLSLTVLWWRMWIVRW